MIGRWGHGHSIGVGALLGLLLTRHLWTLLAGVFLAGLLAGRFWWLLEAAVRRLRRRFAA